MRITFLNPVGVVGGAERVLLATIRGARHRLPTAELRLVLFADGPLHAEAEAFGVTVDVVPLPARLLGAGDTQLRAGGKARALARLGWSALVAAPGAVGFVRQLRRVLRQHAPDLIHSQGIKAHALGALARPAGVPMLWHLQDFYSHRPVMARALGR